MTDTPLVIPDDWRPPHELNRSRPRDVEITGSGRVVAFIAAMMLFGAIALPALMITIDRRMMADAAALRDHGREVQAEVVHLRRANKDRDGYVEYRYTVDGATQDAERRVPPGVWQTLRLGGTLEIRYLPEKPAVSLPRDWSQSPLPTAIPVVMGILFVGIALVFVGLLRTERQLVVDGLATPGIVTSFRRVGRTFAFTYQFQTPDGHLHTRDWRGYQILAVGDVICVLYRQDAPQRSCPYPGKLYRGAGG